MRVVDGDTMEVEVGGRKEKVRLIGVDCPELSHPDLRIREEPFGREAAVYRERRLGGRTVWLEQDVSERDRYGRLLAYVWLDRPWSRSEDEVRRWMFNAELLLQGHAQVMTVPPNVRYQDLFVRLGREAREARKGLWGANEEEQPASVVIVSVDLKAETVVIENRGKGDADLGRWKLVSEVGNQVFVFPAGTFCLRAGRSGWSVAQTPGPARGCWCGRMLACGTTLVILPRYTISGAHWFPAGRDRKPATARPVPDLLRGGFWTTA